MIRLLIGGMWLTYESDQLAMAILRSPCPIERAEGWSDSCGWFNIDITSRNQMKRRINMKKITKLPTYAIGEVIDLSYKNGGLPNRILVDSVYWREQDNGWQYRVTMENTCEKTQMSESFIASRRSSNSAKVYQNPEIIKRIADGFRFCGNFNEDEVRQQARLIAECTQIADVRIYPALYPSNQLVRGKRAIWIRYKNPINNDGIQQSLFNGDCVEVIKGV